MFQADSGSVPNPLRQYLILQFQPERIVMQHTKTKGKFFYKEIKIEEGAQEFVNQLNERIAINHDNLVKISYHLWKKNTVGLLSEYYTSNLETEIARRSRMRQGRHIGQNSPFFTEQQLINTFTPLISCLATLHQENLAHGHLKARNIIVNENFQTKLCDAILVNQDSVNRKSIIQNAYYPPQFQCSENVQVEGDLWALGMIILQATTLQTLEEFYDRVKGLISVSGIQKKIEDINHIYSDEYVVAIKLLLSSDKTLRREGVKVIQNGAIPEGYFNQLRPIRAKHSQRFYDSQSPKKATHIQNHYLMATTTTRFQLTMQETKKQILKQSDNYFEQDKKTKVESIKQKYRNKHGEQAQLKKKQIEKINKIIQRSNAFVNDLMSKRMQKPSTNAKIPSLGKTTINLSVGGYKRQFCNQNSKKFEKTPVREKQEKQRLSILSNASLLAAEIEAIRERSRESPKKLYLKRQPQKLKSLSKKK